MRNIDWYFDFVSPFAWLCLARMRELPQDVEIVYRPVLFAGLLQHWGQKGPAELPTKRLHTYRYCQWWADAHGVSFRFPATHPFNPLHHLRLAIAAGGGHAAVDTIFRALWTTGVDPADASAFAALAAGLDVDVAQLGSPEVKTALRTGTDAAVAAGIFGVPTFVVDGELFWGADAVDFLKAYLADPSLLERAEMKRLTALPVGAARKGA
ncbi:MAG: 2-hydroxychromene-2-carboxylate isomerase [Proteobacteria bacterium]|nr:2-hydroxychromene-2-carboxylate isomerase [Pseudomonadota bacterium]